MKGAAVHDARFAVISRDPPVRGDADGSAATIEFCAACGARCIERSDGTVGGAQKAVIFEPSVIEEPRDRPLIVDGGGASDNRARYTGT